MHGRLAFFLKGDTLKARAARGTMLTIVNFGGQNAIRLASNLILTRLLFPEAFGLMALVAVVQTGLAMFSDLGIRASIVQDERGADPVFLNTAWVLQIGRGAALWLATVAFAQPLATFYEAPLLAQLLPVAGLAALIQGFNSTRMLTADRNLSLGRLTLMTLGAQILSLLAMVLLALWLHSVWALVLGGLVKELAIAVLSHRVLQGPRNRFAFEIAAARRLVGFGKFIFFATIAGFVVNQADRAVMGKFLALDDLAIYNIALLIASIPKLFIQNISTRIIFPLYARKPPSQGPDARAKINTARRLLTAVTVAGAGTLALAGVFLIELLYDIRYEEAGPVAVLISLGLLPTLITLSYHRLPLAAGHSGRFATIIVVLALLQLSVLMIGIQSFGIGGVALAPAVATMLFYPVLVLLILPYKGWDPLHDAGFFSLCAGVFLAAFWMHGESVLPLFAPL